jgi:hypothetical protein
MAEWVIPVVTVLISAGASLAAVWYSESFRRRVRGEIDLRVAEKRFDAYAGLWALTKDASPMLDTPLTLDTRQRLFNELTDWYYKGDGSGMLLIFTRPYGPPPTTGDAPAQARGRTFLKACKIDLTKPPGETRTHSKSEASPSRTVARPGRPGGRPGAVGALTLALRERSSVAWARSV